MCTYIKKRLGRKFVYAKQLEIELINIWNNIHDKQIIHEWLYAIELELV